MVESGVPLFGICLGMQLLFESSEESAGKGLGLLKGKVVRLPLTVKTPHMGWNTLDVVRPNELLNGISEDDYFYFVHSYYGEPSDRDVVAAETDYGLNFASVVACGNVWATQFHPEKSGKSGEIILRNFTGILKK
jgi:glutamine amidotransferase